MPNYLVVCLPLANRIGFQIPQANLDWLASAEYFQRRRHDSVLHPVLYGTVATASQADLCDHDRSRSTRDRRYAPSY